MVRAIVHASELYTGSGVRTKDGRQVVDQDLGVIMDGALVYSTKRVGRKDVPDQILWVGSTGRMPKKWKFAKREVQDLGQRQALSPGFVDCHNHLIFDGERSHEFAQRCAGATYEEIAQQGGGIALTVQATRRASPQRLETLAGDRLRELYAYGVRTVEIKSGYGLSLEEEVKILSVVPRLRKKFPEMTLTATFLGAHAFPPEARTEAQRADYFESLLDTVLPSVARNQLASACDIFVDRGYFTLEQGYRLLRRASELGLQTKVHADELVNTEAATLAVDVGALSADHLLMISESGIQKLARSQTTAVLLPGTAFYLKAAQAPARQLITAGARVALATDFNPGTCMCLSLPAIMTIAALYLGMSRAEIFAAVTYNAARALNLAERKGTLEPGRDADFAILPFARFEDLYYRFAWAPRTFR